MEPEPDSPGRFGSAVGASACGTDRTGHVPPAGDSLQSRDTHGLSVQGGKRYFMNLDTGKGGLAIRIPDKTGFKPQIVRRDGGGHSRPTAGGSLKKHKTFPRRRSSLASISTGEGSGRRWCGAVVER
uniref:Uncharacterized protein n=1 Tax=Molossus molossus TaxID=27622 RepID=A0A7J8BJ90_MOLMO|nr:hypothetical protein HJG59_010460 [Molossus molossus]